MKCRKQKRRDMYQIREFPQAALKETLALEFRANCVETQNMCSISQMTSRVEEEKNWSSALLLAVNSNSVICCLLEIFGKADVPTEPSFIHCPCYIFVHFSRMKIHSVL